MRDFSKSGVSAINFAKIYKLVFETSCLTKIDYTQTQLSTWLVADNY